jgi:hypothetical protein
MTVSRLDELGLEPQVAVRDLLLVGGPAAGGHVAMPLEGRGEFVLRKLPLHIEEYQDRDGEWKCYIIGGGGTTDPLTGEPLGAMIYEADDTDKARFVRSGHNTVNEDQDADLVQVAPYLRNAAKVVDDAVR